MDGLDLLNELSSKIKLLNDALRELRKRGELHAKTDRDYRVALSKKILEQRDLGMPVTIISDVCRGDENIAELRFQRDVAEVQYKSVIEAINSYKLQIRVLENQIDKDYFSN